jgi:hypothetical protein
MNQSSYNFPVTQLSSLGRLELDPGLTCPLPCYNRRVTKRTQAWTLLVALSAPGLMTTVQATARVGADSCGASVACCSRACPVHAKKAAMPASCPMGAADSTGSKGPAGSSPTHPHSDVLCPCSVSQPGSAIVAAQPDFRFDLPRSFSPPVPVRSAHHATSASALLLTGHVDPPEQPPRVL